MLTLISLPRKGDLAFRGWGIWLLLAISLTACAPASGSNAPTPTAPTSAVLQGMKAVVLGRPVGPGKPFDQIDPYQPELGALSAATRALLQRRSGQYAAIVSVVATNASVALDNTDPNYHQLLTRWGRQIGWRVVFDRRGDMGNGSLLRVAVLLSRYAAPSGAHEAFQYVITRQNPGARLTPLASIQGPASPWDEAVLVYSETDAGNGVVLGTFTLIFRNQRIIGFVSTIGVAGAVTHVDTADLTQVVIDRLDSLAEPAR